METEHKTLLFRPSAFATQMTIFLVAISLMPIACNSLHFSSFVNATLHFSGDTVARLCADDGGSVFDTRQGLETSIFHSVQASSGAHPASH